MENSRISNVSAASAEWHSEDFIYKSVVNYLKENGYKVQKEAGLKEENEKVERVINATKFLKKEVIEVKGFPHYYFPAATQPVPAKSTFSKSWFIQGLFDSFMNFNLVENAEVAMAAPNVSRYQAIIKELNHYFSVNDLYFRIYLVNEDGSVEVSNLNSRHSEPQPVLKGE